VAIIGTNASGKSEIGASIASALGGEVLSADSRQVYKGFDLCSGKPDAESRAQVPHHLIDLVEPPTRFTLNHYLVAARLSLADLQQRGRLPVLVGGTPLYAEAVIRGYRMIPVPVDLEARLELEASSNEMLASELDRSFPGEADRIGRRNHRRLVRAVERARHGVDYETAHLADADTEWLIFGVTWEMSRLEERIQERLDRRLAAGMVDEIADALARGIDRQFLWDLGLEYRYILRFIEGDLASPDDFRDALWRAIRKFSKRQMSWFRRWPDVRWTEGALDDRVESISTATREWLAGMHDS
jgi:tRNA dimethylallyltransferase